MARPHSAFMSPFFSKRMLVIKKKKGKNFLIYEMDS